MSKKMDWRRTRKFSGTEEKYAHGTVLGSGRVVIHKPRDTLEARAKHEQRMWGKRGALSAYKPTAYDIARDPSLAPKLRKKRRKKYADDIVLEILSEGT